MDQSAKADTGKAKLSLVPTQIIYDIARIREYSNNKYGSSDNWKEVEPERYRDAAFRHLLAYLDDPKGLDEESGLPHLWHLACNVAFLCEMEDEYCYHVVQVPYPVKKGKNEASDYDAYANAVRNFVAKPKPEDGKTKYLLVPCPRCERIVHVKPSGFDPLYPKGKPTICPFCSTEFYI